MKELAFKRIYRDDGLGFMKRRYSVEEMDAWLRKFQAKTNEICGNQHLVWTIEIWDPGEGPKLTDVNPKVKLIRKNMFPFLDMKISWKPNGLMAFGVYRKENQLLKYLNTSSCHTHSTFKAIPTGVFKRLSRLTSREEGMAKKRIDEIYPDHAKALKVAKLTKEGEFPTFEELWKNEDTDEIAQEKGRKDTRNMYFRIGFSSAWKTQIHKIINDLVKKSSKLRWIRLRISNHRFSNLSELFYGDLVGKIRKDVRSWI